MLPRGCREAIVRSLGEEFMVTAFVLINAEPGKVPAAAQALAEIAEVPEVYSVAGAYDIVAVVRVREFEHLSQVVSERLAAVPGIAHTQTLVAFRCYPESLMEHLFGLGLEEAADKEPPS